jgi:mono/diheme cytochrome c family protein
MTTAKATTIICLAVILLLVGICYGFFKSEGLSARKKPSNFEYAIANRALALSIPTTAKNAKNPMIATPEVLMDARKSYSDNCAVCHADDGTGKTNTARGLSPEVPDLHAEHIRELSDGEIFYIIKNGVRFTAMPGWDFRDEQIWKLVLLIRQFAKENASAQPGRQPS